MHILAIGHDVVEIKRFEHWHRYPDTTLLRIFSQEELNYCRAEPSKTAERLAVRFATREALYKAASSVVEEVPPFLALCKVVTIKKTMRGPELALSNHFIEQYPALKNCILHCTLSHTSSIASSFVLIQTASSPEQS